MLRILGTIFAALLGLCFGSFLNVCLSRWPAGESVVHPRSHCRACGRTLAWWENVPLVSWIALRGRCRGCGVWISVRYPIIELVVGFSWACIVWQLISRPLLSSLELSSHDMILFGIESERSLALLVMSWFLVALAALDAEHLWLPDVITLPGIAVGILFHSAYVGQLQWYFLVNPMRYIGMALLGRFLAAALAAAIILLIRWVYWLIRRREGLGLGDAKLMAMLAAWLGLPGALLSLFLGVVLGAVYAVYLLTARSRRSQGSWATAQLPLGTFLCIGGIVSALWGKPIIAAYLQLFP
jgi:leader peptidase (prepilin peptidase)/N-methyltransferase